MSKSDKLTLADLKVQSFVTTLEPDETQNLVGGISGVRCFWSERENYCPTAYDEATNCPGTGHHSDCCA
jgi:hypothetical protein